MVKDLNERKEIRQIFTTYFFDSKMEWCKPVDILADSIREAQSICERIIIKKVINQMVNLR